VYGSAMCACEQHLKNVRSMLKNLLCGDAVTRAKADLVGKRQ